jgi:hypothetical protein
MFPNVADAFSGWNGQVTLKVVDQTVSDFETVDVPITRESVRGVLQPIPPRKLMVKPEGQRAWKWWTFWTKKTLSLNAILIDSDGKQFKVMSDTDYRQAGFNEYELAQEPV